MADEKSWEAAPGAFDLLQEHHAREFVAEDIPRLCALFHEYALEPGDWAGLAWRLARDYRPEFKRQKRSDGTPDTKEERDYMLVLSIAFLESIRPRNIDSFCQQLATIPYFEDVSGDQLRDRYYRLRRATPERQRLVEFMRKQSLKPSLFESADADPDEVRRMQESRRSTYHDPEAALERIAPLNKKV